MTERMRRLSERMKRGGKALIPYFTAGFPTLEESREVFISLAQAGADCLEIGVPFSDPLADGPTIQRASERALKAGGGLTATLELVQALRKAGVEIPCILFGYYNPVYRMGLEEFAGAAEAAGADGALVPDLPVEESAPLEKALAARGLGMVHLIAPTSTEERIAEAHRRSCGFIYAVSLTGVTGARDTLPPDLAAFVGRAKRLGGLPVAVGFGVKTPGQAAEVAGIADGVVVGSAFIDAAEKGGRTALAELAGAMKRSIEGKEE